MNLAASARPTSRRVDWLAPFNLLPVTVFQPRHRARARRHYSDRVTVWLVRVLIPRIRDLCHRRSAWANLPTLPEWAVAVGVVGDWLGAFGHLCVDDISYCVSDRVTRVNR